MTEQEIIECLKENKNKGVANLFLPEEVRDWVSEHFDEPMLLYLDSLGKWEKFDICSVDDCDNIVFSLPDDYQVKKESKGEWVEFTITDGVFTAKIECDESESYTEDFHWWDWQGFLTKSFDYDMNYTAFGGWQYEPNDFWLTQPHVKNEENLYTTLTNRNEDCRPAIPVRIRFWRERK